MYLVDVSIYYNLKHIIEFLSWSTCDRLAVRVSLLNHDDTSLVQESSAVVLAFAVDLGVALPILRCSHYPRWLQHTSSGAIA